MKMDIKIVLIIILGLMLVGASWLFFAEPKVSEITPRTIDPITGIKIVAFGDSLTAGYGLVSGEAYPAQLEAKLKSVGYSVTVINAGVSGETTRGNLERVPFILSQKPDLVIWGIGGNDALRALPITETRSNMQATLKALTSGDNPPVVLMLQMQAPLNAGLSYKREFDALYESLASEYQVRLVPFLTAELFLDSANKQSDGIHYNKLGYEQVVTKHVAPAVIEVLEAMEQ